MTLHSISVRRGYSLDTSAWIEFRGDTMSLPQRLLTLRRACTRQHRDISVMYYLYEEVKNNGGSTCLMIRAHVRLHSVFMFWVN